jgi:hypothetical protein
MPKSAPHQKGRQKPRAITPEDRLRAHIKIVLRHLTVRLDMEQTLDERVDPAARGAVRRANRVLIP